MGIRVITVSTKENTAIGADGGEAKVDVLLEDLKVDELEAVIFIGGPGALKYLDNSESYRVVKEVINFEKVLGAICIASVILARAGGLNGKKATVWSSSMDRSSVRTLEESGAKYLEDKVVIDGKIITANGPQAAKEFGEKLKEILT